ncbi:hypothetical protein NMR31_003292 [Vibrio cholerae]|uniref:hypothetical protein n=1 Tax=Vibrio cholerae TaxID=666 RepID=UPI00115BDD2B|nr:hypothetical protein [Vibrio cholerae]EJL6267967.1 hypothetical protein [Vibrio cholerae]EJL6282301.1 hypothetical protein [Vibrio cholerae]EJL6852693.1 hypothetical protein [Vibrio cholerae]EJL9326712.1 hypothetical protein [Vibrio cholerae]EJX9126108.1 hypothetical protein [Vibrio cholerae]
MTTTIYDKLNKQVASDTRWSVRVTLSDEQQYLVYVDTCCFEKIADKKNTTLVLAGNGKLIAQWKDWWYNSMDMAQLPPTDVNGKNEVNLMIIDKINNDVLFDAGQKKAIFCTESSSVLSVFAGSGDIHAASCWHMNRCVQTAIITASNKDYYTSHIVKYVDFTTGKSNLGAPNCNYDSIVTEMLDKGFIMKMTASTAANDVGTPLNQHQIHQEVKDLLLHGKAVASAPVPGISEFKWNEANKQKLGVAIDKVKELEQ